MARARGSKAIEEAPREEEEGQAAEADADAEEEGKDIRAQARRRLKLRGRNVGRDCRMCGLFAQRVGRRAGRR